jgi:hypothetical protein
VGSVNDGTRHSDGQYPIMGKTDASPIGRGGEPDLKIKALRRKRQQE